MNEDKKHVSIEDIMAQLDKNTLSMVRRGREIEKNTIPTASFGLNQILGGGLYLGKQHTIWGNESSGKSALMLQTIGINQKRGIPCAWIDAEHSFDAEWAARLGVNTDELLVSPVSSIADVNNLQVKFISAGMGLIVVDSTSALLPKSYFEEGELKDFDKRRQVGQLAKDLGEMCSTVQSINFNTAIVHISQVRMDLGNSFMPGMKATGGKQTEHSDQVRVRLFSSKSEKQAIMGQVQRGSLLIEERVGRKVTWDITKNKVNGRYGTGEYDLYTLGTEVGVSRASELVAYGIKYGIITKGGAWYTIYGERYQGETKIVNAVREDIDLQNKLEKDIAESL